MLHKKNGRGSSSISTRHIKIRYFLIKDRIESGEVILVYCPTETMSAYAFIKPLQVNTFIRFRYSIMNVSCHKNNDIKTSSMLRIHGNKGRKPHK